jgi:hypothetical protein
VDRSASERRCVSTASKSDAITPIRPLCKQHDVGYEQSSAKGRCPPVLGYRGVGSMPRIASRSM